MSSSWEDLLDTLKNGSAAILKGELRSLLETTKADSEEFVQRQARKLERYLNQLAAGVITREQFEGYVLDLKALTAMEALRMSVAGRASAQRLADGIGKLVIDGLLKLL